MHTDIQEIQAKVEQESSFVERLTQQISSVIVGHQYLIDRLLIGILADGHILIEGVPGLAKTLSVKTLSDAIDAKFQRLQFTPDLLPADLIGTMIYNPQTSEFSVKKGPVFANIILADEINSMNRFWCWRRRTRLSRKEPIRCRKRRSIGSC